MVLILDPDDTLCTEQHGACIMEVSAARKPSVAELLLPEGLAQGQASGSSSRREVAVTLNK